MGDMSGIEKRLPMLLEMRKKHLKQLYVNQSDPAKDKSGSATNSLVGTLRFLAVADYVLKKDIVGFRSKLSEAAGLRSKLFNRFDAGEAISPSYVSMLSYKALCNALASGDLQLANELANHMGGATRLSESTTIHLIWHSDTCLRVLYLKMLSASKSGYASSNRCAINLRMLTSKAMPRCSRQFWFAM
jgi:hypothetical protein